MQNDTRVSDTDREAVAARLREHYAAGRSAWTSSRTGWTRCTGRRSPVS